MQGWAKKIDLHHFFVFLKLSLEYCTFSKQTVEWVNLSHVAFHIYQNHCETEFRTF